MDNLFEMHKILKDNNIQLILIQIDEAHTDRWPIGLPNTVKPHKTFQDRIDRANEFVNKWNPPYKVYIDGWNNEFSNKFQAWPDEHYYVGKDLIIIERSEYSKDTCTYANACTYDNACTYSNDCTDACVIEDYPDYLIRSIKSDD